MNLEQLKEWLKEAKYIDTPDSSIDGCGNREDTRIFEKGGQLYSIEYCNNHPNPKWDDKCGNMSERDENGVRLKDTHGEYLYIYEPMPVIKKTYKKTIDVVEYLHDGHIIARAYDEH